MTTEKDLIISLYSFTEEEQKLFPYARKYMAKIKPKLPWIVEEPEVRERFMLAGLFITYKAFKHLGCVMTTDPNILSTYLGYPNSDDKRLLEFKRITGKDIKDMHHYLRMIKYNAFKHILSPFIGMDLILYNFVINGW